MVEWLRCRCFWAKAGDAGFQTTNVHRFAEVQVEPGCVCALHVFLLPPSGNGDQQRMPTPLRGTYALRHVIAVHSWQADVKNRRFRTKARSDAKGLLSRISHFDVVPKHAQ